VFAGGAFSWLIAIPLYAWLQGGLPADIAPADFAAKLWSTRIRYLGVGAMLVGGLWALWGMRAALVTGFQRVAAADAAETEKDLPRPLLMALTVILSVPMYLFYRH